MALALIYIFAIAKSISIRRLAAFFVLIEILAVAFLGLLQVRNIQSTALSIATSLTLFVWSMPMLQVFGNAIVNGKLSFQPLRCASASVQCTYAFAIIAISMIAASVLLKTPGFSVGQLPEVLWSACIIALISRLMCYIWISRRPIRRRTTTIERVQPQA